MSEPARPTFWQRAAAIAAAVMYAAAIGDDFLFNLIRNARSGSEVPVSFNSSFLYVFIILLVSPRVLLRLRGFGEGALFAAAYGFFAQFALKLAGAAARGDWSDAYYLAPLFLLFFLVAGRVDKTLSSPRESHLSRPLEVVVALGLILGFVPIIQDYYTIIYVHAFEVMYSEPIFYNVTHSTVINVLPYLLLVPVSLVYFQKARTVPELPKVLWLNHSARVLLLVLVLYLSRTGIKILGPGIGWMWTANRPDNLGAGVNLVLRFWSLAHMAVYALIFSSLAPARRDLKGHLFPGLLAVLFIGLGWVIYFIFSPNFGPL